MIGTLSNAAESDETSVKKKLASWVSFFMSDRYYKTSARTWTHISMWIGLAVMNLIMFYSGFKVSVPVSVSFLIRNMLGCMFAFYIVFYFVIPKLLLRGHWFLAVIGLCLPYLFWAVLNYLSAVYITANYEVTDPGLKRMMDRMLEGGWSDALSISNLLRILIPVTMTMGPVIFA